MSNKVLMDAHVGVTNKFPVDWRSVDYILSTTSPLVFRGSEEHGDRENNG
jgi:hypothetical protein